MARYKTAKRTVKQSSKSKRPTSTNTSTNMVKVEKGFMEAPLKLAAYFTKENNTLLKKESKLQKAVSKMHAQITKSEARIKAGPKNTTTAGKKKFRVLQKAQGDL